MIKKRSSILAMVLMIFSVFSTAIASTAAWFIVTSVKIPPVVSSGSAILSYFESGNGSSEDPYVIARPKQLYNFSWLQAKGAFTEKTYFELGNNIDMAGKLTGGETTSGAIPPIGTTSNPFIGSFDGKGYKISNLWVSSDPNDWKEKPANFATLDVESDIGFFGRCGNETDSAEIKNFYLENIEVTNHKSGSDVSVGLVAGFVDCDMSKIGVINGKINVKGAGIVCGSEYALVGKTDVGVVWTDLPNNDGGTGDLIVDPINDETCAIQSGTSPVPYSKPNSAFYVGTLTRSQASPAKAVYAYNNMSQCAFSNDKAKDPVQITINTGNSTKIIQQPGQGFNPSNDPNDMVDDRFEEIYGAATIVYKIDGPANVPNFSNARNSTSYPTNCIWFKPQNSGDACVAFARTDKSNDEYMSCYRFKRDANGAYIPSSLRELIFKFEKGKGNVGLSNGDIAYFTFKISDSDVENGYEYAIGKSSVTASGGSAGFVFLKLAGTDTKGDIPDDSVNVLENIDFVNTVGVFDSSDYKVHRVVLNFGGVPTATVNYYMNATADNSQVQYTTIGNPPMSDKITLTSQSIQVPYSTSVYPNRQET